MCFHVGFVNHIQAVLVAQFIEIILVRIVRGTNRIDVILLHGEDVPADFFFRDGTSTGCTKFMPVYAIEYNPLAVQFHDAIFHAELPNTDLLRNNF